MTDSRPDREDFETLWGEIAGRSSDLQVRVEVARRADLPIPQPREALRRRTSQDGRPKPSQKLGVSGRSDLVRYALEQGLIGER